MAQDQNNSQLLSQLQTQLQSLLSHLGQQGGGTSGAMTANLPGSSSGNQAGSYYSPSSGQLYGHSGQGNLPKDSVFIPQDISSKYFSQGANKKGAKDYFGDYISKLTTPPTPITQSNSPAPLTPQINTGQPNPQTVNATPYTGGSIVDALNSAGLPSDKGSRNALAGQYGIQNYQGTAQQNTQMLQRFRQGFNNAKTSGLPSPTTTGAGAAGVQQHLPTPQTQQQPSAVDTQVDTALATDPFFADLTKKFQDYMNPDNQRTSLTDEYNKLLESSGLKGINTQLMDMKKVINGTEKDIRDEVTKSGGFATESQVQALTGARNNQLIKNYNALLESKNSTQDYVNTMIGLVGKDREAADSRFDKMLDFSTKMQDYKNKALENTKDRFQHMSDKIGYNGLYEAYKNDPQQLSYIEKIMGYQPGGLAQLAAASPAEKKDTQVVDIAGRKVLVDTQTGRTIRDLGSSTAEGGGKATQPEIAAAGYAERVGQANTVIDEIGANFTGKSSYLGALLPNALKSTDRQKFEQAQDNFINAVLRRESGAAISPSEFDSARKQYFPQPGDTKGVLEQKKQNRLTVQRNLQQSAGKAIPLSSNSNDPLGLF